MAAKLAEQTADLPAVPTAPTPGGRRRASTGRGRARDAISSVPGPAIDRVPAWEWVLTVIALFVLGRSPILFYRGRVGDLFDAGPPFYIWQDDGVVRATFATVLFVMYVVAARRCRPRTLLRQPFLMAFLALCVASVTWSIEPTASLWRVSFFVGTAALGWYIGERYTPRELAGIVGAVAATGALASLVALLVWPGTARSTNRVDGAWSGAYVNRNLFALVLGAGLLAIPFLWSAVPRRRRPLLLAVAGLEAFLLFKTGSRTPVVGLASAAAVAIPLVGVRYATTRALKPIGGAFGVSLVAGYVGLIVFWNWTTILQRLGRRTDLTRRTTMWAIDRYYASFQLWKGWGFEAIWAHPPTIGVAESVYRKFPYSSHSGYYEVLLSVGVIGLALFGAFLVTTGWRAFRFAWVSRNPASIFPLAFLVFAIVVNVSESLFVSGDAFWALTVAVAFVTMRRSGPGGVSPTRIEPASSR